MKHLGGSTITLVWRKLQPVPILRSEFKEYKIFTRYSDRCCVSCLYRKFDTESTRRAGGMSVLCWSLHIETRQEVCVSCKVFCNVIGVTHKSLNLSNKTYTAHTLLSLILKNTLKTCCRLQIVMTSLNCCHTV